MDLIPWRSFGRNVSSLRSEMDNLFDRFFGESPLGRPADSWLPRADLSETKDAFVVTAELPGLEAKDVKVSMSGDLLTIEGEKKKEKEEKDENFHYTERYQGSFRRSFQLSGAVKEEKVEASFKNGVLKVNLPKAEETKKKEITVKVK